MRGILDEFGPRRERDAESALRVKAWERRISGETHRAFLYLLTTDEEFVIAVMKKKRIRTNILLALAQYDDSFNEFMTAWKQKSGRTSEPARSSKDSSP
jgi:hypothetical protein